LYTEWLSFEQSDAHLTTCDRMRKTTVAPGELHANAGYAPFEGMTVTGWPETVILVDEGQLHKALAPQIREAEPPHKD
jgi:dihydroorotase-like cyclic amidohydrolase